MSELRGFERVTLDPGEGRMVTFKVGLAALQFTDEHPQRTRVRAAEDHARDRPRRGAGAKVYVFWGGREGVETDASKDPLAAIKRYATRGGLRP